MQRAGLPIPRPSSSSFVAFAALSLVLGTIGVGCSSRPTAEEVVERSARPICEKLEECAGSSFATAYPDGIDECVSKTIDSVSQTYGSDLDKASACTDDEVDQCLETFKTSACSESGGLPSMPCRC